MSEETAGLDIEVRNLRVCYRNTVAIEDLSLRLPAGKVYGLLGRNGSGKTSLLTVLGAFQQATAGTVLVGGEPVFENRRITSQICLIRDELDVYQTATGIRALKLAERFRPNWDADYAHKLMAKFDIPLRKKVMELSRGKRSAFGIVLGLASRAPLTMFDESYLGMDAPSRYAFYDELLADYMAHPRTMILSTHLIAELGSLFEETIIIDKGRLVLHEDTDALRTKGVTITGPADEVDRFVAGHTVLGEQRLGSTKQLTIYGQLDDADRRAATRAGLDLGPVAVQDLFVYLTRTPGEFR